jgi:hypothetical protein
MALAPERPSGSESGTVEEKPTGPLHDHSMMGGSPAGDVADEQNEEYIDGFSWRTVFGALFIGLIMMPGAIYLGLVAGQGMGPAAEWVTIILFMEVARRSYQTLKKQELYLLYYMGAALASPVGALSLSGGAFAHLIMNQYVLGTPLSQGSGITGEIPTWVQPAQGSEALMQRTFIHQDWLPAIGLLMIGQILGRMNSWGLGYVLFRITSDVEKLPFPLASIAAEGATALAESSSQKEGWRWRVFSIGAMIGVGWGFIYILIPAITGIVFSQPIVIVTNPFIDYTGNTKSILPAALTGIGTDLGGVLIGFVLPLPIVIGTFISSIAAHIVANPFLQRAGILRNWTAGLDLTQSTVANNFDFWLSFGIGTAIVVAVIGIGSVIRAISKQRQQQKQGVAGVSFAPPKGRGDISIWISLGIWAIATAGYVVLCQWLVPGFPLGYLIFFGFVWTPIFSYINARMSGMAGTHVSIPYVREGSFMLAGYQRADIWFAPIPLNDFGGMAQHFRTVELTRTKFTSILKVELLMLPVMLICSFLFWSFIWKLSPIPSSSYPYAAKFWPVHAQGQIMWWTANRGDEGNFLKQAINLNYIGVGGAFAIISYLAIWLTGLPILLFYGLVNGTHVIPPFAIPGLIGGLLGRYYFQKRYGIENWRAYAPVLVAGYYCGMGLIGMGSVATVLLAKSVSRLPF